MASIRMGDMAVSSRAGDELVALGLGSCIGLALLDRGAGVAGLAHIVLPTSTDPEDEIGKFADLAVPELISRMLGAGARQRRIEAVLVGGAHMFAAGELDIGSRNEQAVRAALAAARVPVRAAATGGSSGRTIRIVPDPGTVIAREAGGETITLLGDGAPPPSQRPRPTPSQAGTVGARP